MAWEQGGGGGVSVLVTLNPHGSFTLWLVTVLGINM